jgi:stage V sporulation protein AB
METCIFWGGMAGTVITVFQLSVPIGSIGLAVFGLFAGIFIGCLAMALAETLKVIPVLVQRTKLGTGLPILVTAMGLGKALACFYQMFFRF